MVRRGYGDRFGRGAAPDQGWRGDLVKLVVVEIAWSWVRVNIKPQEKLLQDDRMFIYSPFAIAYRSLKPAGQVFLGLLKRIEGQPGVVQETNTAKS